MLLDLTNGRELPVSTIVFVGDRLVPAKFWKNVYPKNGSLITVRVHVHSGEGVRTAAMIAVGIAALWVSGGALTPVLGSGFAAGSIGASAAGMAVTAVGMLAINALVPLSSPKFESQTSSPTLSITGARNNERPFSPVPMILGTFRYTPPLAATSFTTTDGADQYLTMLVTGGYGPITISDMQIGKTPLDSFTDVTTQVNEGYQDDDDITLYPGDVQQDSLNIRIYNGTWRQLNGAHPDPNPCTLPGVTVYVPNPNCYMRVTPSPCFKFRIDIVLPNGAIQIKNQGDRETMIVDMEVWYREVGATTNYLPGPTLQIQGRTNSVIRRSITFTPPTEPTGEVAYEVVLRRLTLDDREGVDPDDENTRYSETRWTSLTAFSATDPISDVIQPCLSEIALEIRATSQLNGVIDDFNFLGRLVALDYDGTPGEWSRRTTNNPASLFRYVLQCTANKQRVDDCRINIDELERWHDFCRLKGFTFNMVRDFQSTLLDVLTDIAGAGRARPDQIDGLWTVVVDNQDNYVTPVQLFTERNSWNFSGSKQMIDIPHALRIRYVDQDLGFVQTGVTAYADGYNELTATRYESIEFPGLTNARENLCMGEYQLKVSELRQERFSFQVDVEHIVCVPGDSILRESDSIKKGFGSARIDQVFGSVIILDSLISYTGNLGVVHRADDGTITVIGAASNMASPSNNFTLDATTAVIKPGDLITVGVLSQETLHLVVDSIIPSKDLSATLNCYPVAPETDVVCP